MKENKEKHSQSTVLPHMVANVGEVLNANNDDDEEKDGLKQEKNNKNKKSLVYKTTDRHTILLHVISIVEPETLKPGESIKVNMEPL